MADLGTEIIVEAQGVYTENRSPEMEFGRMPIAGLVSTGVRGKVRQEIQNNGLQKKRKLQEPGNNQ